MATIARPSVIHVTEERPSISLAERVTIGLAAFNETVREGLLAFCVGVGLSVVAEIFEQEFTQLVGPRGKPNRNRTAYRHGQEDRQLTLGGRRVEVQKPKRGRVVRRSRCVCRGCAPVHAALGLSAAAHLLSRVGAGRAGQYE